MKSKDIHSLGEDLLLKFLQRECSEQEFQQVKLWMDQASDEQVKELFRLEERYQLGKMQPEVCRRRMEKAEKQLFDRIHLMQQTPAKVRMLNSWLRYAAIFIGCFFLSGMGYWLWNDRSWEEPLLAVSTQDEVRELVLPDGTKVWLNKFTTFRYPREFAAQERKVFLEGEGYFEVKKNPQYPFIVQSEAMQVKVLGTVFNFKSDKESQSAVATLLQGEIEVKGNHEEGMIILAPGQQAELDGASKRLVVKQINTGIENWHNHSFAFENADIFTIARTLEKYFDIKIVLSSDLDTEKTYSGVLKKSENIKEVLELISLVVPVTYTIHGTTIYLSAGN